MSKITNNKTAKRTKSSSHALLPGSERTALPGARPLGPANPDEWLELTLKLRRKKALPDLPGRPKQALTREKLAAEYGAAPADIDKVKTISSRFGLDVLDTNPQTRTIRLGGTVSAMEQAFQVKLLQYAHENGNYRGRAGVLHVPSELNGIVVGVFGLDNRRVARKRRPAGQAFLGVLATAARRSWFFPGELAQIYDFPPGDGSGQSIGVLEFGGGYFQQDLAAFCNAAGVSVPNVVPISVDHAPTNVLNSDAIEVMLDIEVIAGVCPKATIPVYFSHFSEQGWVDALDAAIHDSQNKPTVLSISWGFAEDVRQVWSVGAIDSINETLKEAALLGITVCVASGDDGSDDQVGDGHAHVDFPASSPYVLGVGGTSLHVRNGKSVETVWKDGDGLRKDHGGSTGGGVSAHFDRPSWQTVGIQSVNPGAKVGRCVPDVAADASGHTGYFMVINGQTIHEGGTSAATPLWAALIARLNAALSGNQTVGYLTPVLYQPGPGGGAFGAAVCKDITKGDNISAAIGGYRALPGYDAATGWGSPSGRKLLAALQAIVNR